MGRRIIAPGLFRLGRRIVAWVFKMPVDEEVEQEIDFHVEMRIRELESRGVPRDEAHRAVLARFGDLERVKADMKELGRRRDVRMERKEWWGETLRDVRYGLRQLRRAPVFTVIAVMTLALGIGANTAVFSVLNGVLLRPLPYAAPERLVMVTSAFPTMDFDRFWISPPEYFELREWNQAFKDVGGYRTGSAAIETLDQPLRVTSAVATWSLFPTLGVQAVRGRTFSPEEDLPGAEPVVLISHGLWERAFGGDPGIIGSSVRVSGQPRTVVGVLPEDFDVEDAAVDVWTPTNIDPSDHVNRRGNHFLNVVARLADGVTLERAQADLDRLELRWQEEYGDTHAPSPDFHPYQASDLRTDLLGDVRPAMFLLMGAVAFVLLIACANVANLLLARSEQRHREVAVRVAMGAGRGRLVRQLLAEGVTLGLAGGLVGLGLGYLAVETILTVNPDIPRAGGIQLDGTVMAFTAAVAVATGLLFGLAPLLNTTLARVGGALSEGGARATHGSAGARVRKALVVAEVGLAVVLLTGSGLMLRSLSALQDVDLGFDPENLLSFQISLPNGAYATPQDVVGFYDDLLGRVRALPGVVSATAMSGLPPLRDVDANDTEFEGVPRTEDGPAHNVDYWTGVQADFLETTGIQVVEGRGFESADEGRDDLVMLVNERLARTFYPGSTPVGRRLRPCCGDDNPWLTVVGVVADVKQAGVNNDAGTELFFLNPQIGRTGYFAYRTMSMVVRTERDPLLLAPPIRRILGELDAAIPMADVQSMETHVARTMAQPRFLTLLLGLFAAIALVLAAVGTYGVMSYSVAARNREIGIRMAMGAEALSVQRMMLVQGTFLAGAGVILGIGGAMGLTRFLSSQLFVVSATDPQTFVVAPLFLGAVALLACFLPARRATRVDPVQALRDE
ncbi:MAG: ABC transporter permease [Gemmatimonadota bacterium]